MIRRIIGGEFPPGSMLPPEAILAEEFGVSRNPIREATKVLTEKGVISIQHGRGSIVQDPALWDALDPGILTARLERSDTAWQTFSELSQVRVALESEMARAAAERITPAEIERLRGHVAEMEQAAGDPGAYTELDFRFHDLVMESSANSIAHAMMLAISGPLRQSRKLTNQIPGGVENAHQFHMQIFERIADHDARGAEKVMREHLEWSLEHLGNLQAVAVIHGEHTI